MSEQSDQPTNTTLRYSRPRRTGGRPWTVSQMMRALRALVKARDQNPQARVRITNDQAKVLLDVPPVGAWKTTGRRLGGQEPRL